MKPTFLIAASLIIGTAAVAQTTNPDASASQPTTAPAATPDMAPAPAPAPADAAAPAPAADPAPAPMAAPADAAPAQTADTSNYPACSRTVHDKCVQKGAVAHKRHR